MTESIEFVNEAPPISDGGAHNKSIAFVNDWSELEAAVEWYRSIRDKGSGEHNEWHPEGEHALSVIVDYVPRLLTQYASLVELSFALTEGWEQYASLQAPTGLYLPDHSQDRLPDLPGR